AARVCLVAAVGLAFVWLWWSIQTLRNAEYAHVVAGEALATELRRVEQVRLLEHQQQALVRRASLVEALVESMPRSAILRELGAALPTGVALERLCLTTQRRHAADATRLDYDVQVALAGQADSTRQTSAFVSRLRTSTLFADEGDLHIRPSGRVAFEAELEVRVGL
ncbi:MAG: PilN domain-containing protein, partial [Planctomycetota bacterium]